MTVTRVAPLRPAGRMVLAGIALLGMTAVHFWPAEVAAQSPGTGFASAYQGNAGKPVDIEAETLEVDDNKKTAIFRGSVSATQGDMNLKSKEIYVTYAPADKKTASAGSNDATSPMGGGNTEITFIDAKGNVFVTVKPKDATQKPQTAKGDNALFDVKKQLITLSGNVVLTQGENVLQGSKATVELATGRFLFDNTANVGGSGGKVRAVFTPPPKDKDKDKNKEGHKEGAQ